MGLSSRQVSMYPNEPQKVGSSARPTSTAIHVCVGFARQYKAVEVSRWQVYTEPVRAQRYSELYGG